MSDARGVSGGHAIGDLAGDLEELLDWNGVAFDAAASVSPDISSLTR
jgi:hypothetical protein